MVFDVFLMPDFYNGSIHEWNYLRRAKNCLNRETWNYIKQFFFVNGAYFHPENVLISGLKSPLSPPATKVRAKDMIVRAMQNPPNELRRFKNPTENQVNMDATNFFDYCC